MTRVHSFKRISCKFILFVFFLTKGELVIERKRSIEIDNFIFVNKTFEIKHDIFCHVILQYKFEKVLKQHRSSLFLN